MKLPHPLLLASAALLASACTTAPLSPVPDPLPETLEWVASHREPGAFLGLATRENDSGSLDALTFDPGVRVTEVVENSPAAIAGVEVGDVVLALDGAAVDDPGALEELLRRAEPGTGAELRVQRGDTVFAVPVVLAGSAAGAGGEARVLWRLDPARTAAGWADGVGGAVLASAGPGSPVTAAGLEIGDVVQRLDGAPVLSGRDLVRRVQALEEGEAVRLAGTGADGEPFEREVRLLSAPTAVTGWSIPILAHYSRDLERDESEFALVDLWVISLFRFLRDGDEREYRVLRFFTWRTGVGELSE